MVNKKNSRSIKLTQGVFYLLKCFKLNPTEMQITI